MPFTAAPMQERRMLCTDAGLALPARSAQQPAIATATGNREEKYFSRTDLVAFKWMNIGEFVYKRQEQVGVKLEMREGFGWVSNTRGEGMEHLSQVWFWRAAEFQHSRNLVTNADSAAHPLCPQTPPQG